MLLQSIHIHLNSLSIQAFLNIKIEVTLLYLDSNNYIRRLFYPAINQFTPWCLQGSDSRNLSEIICQHDQPAADIFPAQHRD